MKFSRGKLSEWEEALKKTEGATFYNTPLWYELQAKHFKKPLEVYKAQAGEINYIFPLFKVRRNRIFTFYNTSLLGTYGTVLNIENRKGTTSSIMENFAKGRNLYFSGNPFIVEEHSSDKQDFTQIIDLSRFSLQNLKGNHRRAIEKAKNGSLIIIEAQGLEDWNAYYNIYNKVTKERGALATNSYKSDLFSLINKLPLNCRKLWLVMDKKNIVGGGIFFYFNNKVHHWHGAIERKAQKLFATYFLHYEVISHAKENGYEIYDFNPSGGHAGVVKFKSGFNPTKLTFTLIENENLFYRSALKVYKWIR